MTKSNPRIAEMNQKTWKSTSLIAALLVAGCSTHATSSPYDGNSPIPQDMVLEQPAPATNVTTASGKELISYRETAADYREYGERMPTDQDIVNSGAGSNMSASIPPTIDEEVADYENEVNAAINEGSSDDSSAQSSGEDPVEDWLAEEGSTLKGLLTDWSERAGWRLIWNSNRNYTLAAGAMFRGRFADVSSALIRTFARARPAPVATFYKGNRVLVVETMEDENAYD